MTPQFDLTQFYNVIVRNSVFLTRFSNTGIPDPVILLLCDFPTIIVKIKNDR